MTTNQMKYFIEVAKCLSFTGAADRLFLSQPALSRQIAMLENELNAQLFIRSKNVVRLTPAGQVLLDGLQDVYGDYKKLVASVQAVNLGTKGALSIGFLQEQLLPDPIHAVLRQFAKMNPEIGFYLSKHSFQELRSGLLDGTLDLVITFSLDLIDQHNIRRLVFERSPLFLVVESHHPLAERQEILPEEYKSLLKNELFIFISPENSEHMMATAIKDLEVHGFRPHYICSLGDSQMSLWVSIGKGVTILNNNHVLFHNPGIRFIYMPGLPYIEMAIAWHKDSSSKIIPLFLERLQALTKI